MIKKEVTVDGFDGPETRTYYFHMTRAEALRWAKETNGELSGELERVANLPVDGDVTDLLEMTGRILHRSVGLREGNRFIKSREIADDFVFSGALDAVLDDLLTNPEECDGFIKGILPANAVEEAKKP